MDIKAIEQELFSLSKDNIVAYVKRVVPDAKPVIGVALPKLRTIAKRIVKDDWRTFLTDCPDEYFEQQILKAYVIGYANADIEEMLMYADAFVLKIKDWAVNDAFCASFKIALGHRERVYQWLMDYAEKEDAFLQRMAAVMLMTYFLDDTYILKVFHVMDKLKHEGYYTKMAVAWCVATAFAYYPKETMEYLNNNQLDKWIYNKAIQKMLESFRISAEDKEILRSMKRK